ncbi:hypothetical protein RHMOL_Rhmol08G0226200 [Rhododendron molle]|uniref:Uncharacterized protein n=1 Tax=Rhododendron molle TaxID=49168 RepID=A0ACC0MR72_RHOML|nr:hypothetical protein RHMOL_Rhmol08G0226200 [Rhododendron molle]
MGVVSKAGDWTFKAFTAGLGLATIYLAATFSANVYRGLSWHNAQSLFDKSTEVLVNGGHKYNSPKVGKFIVGGLLRDLVLIFDQDMRDVQIESDSSTAVQMINEGSPPNSPCIMLTLECKALVENTLREGNKVARMNCGTRRQDGVFVDTPG